MARVRERSYPPSVWGGDITPASGAVAGIPGTWLPDGATPPASPAALSAGVPVFVEADPATAWTSGQYVQTQTAGVAGRATWTGTNWVSGAAPLDEPAPAPAKTAAKKAAPSP